MVAKLAQNGCDTDMSCAWICWACQDGSMGFPFWNGPFWHSRLVPDQVDPRMQKWPISKRKPPFGHLSVLIISIYMTHLCRSYFGPFWQSLVLALKLTGKKPHKNNDISPSKKHFNHFVHFLISEHLSFFPYHKSSYEQGSEWNKICLVLVPIFSASFQNALVLVPNSSAWALSTKSTRF